MIIRFKAMLTMAFENQQVFMYCLKFVENAFFHFFNKILCELHTKLLKFKIISFIK